MTLSFFLPLNCTLPCRREKGDPQLSVTAEEGQGRSSALSHASLGGKGNCRVLCLWFLRQIGASRDRKLKNLVSLPPCLQCPMPKDAGELSCWDCCSPDPIKFLFGASGNRLVRQVGKTVLCSAQHLPLPSPSFKPRGSDKSVKCIWEYLELHFGQTCHTLWCRMPYFFWQDLHMATLPSPLEILQPLLSVSRCCASETTVLQKRGWIATWNIDPCL